ncbi:hypothetical protein GF312_13750 [Candidatus Poribacteria bacterium]|nr:hypothetical protein [Candidatus Poribacteria bacterium]
MLLRNSKAQNPPDRSGEWCYQSNHIFPVRRTRDLFNLLKSVSARIPFGCSGEVSQKPAFTAGRAMGFFILFVLLSFSTSAFELILDDGVNESMVELALSRVPANATIGINKIYVYSGKCHDFSCKIRKLFGGNDIYGKYRLNPSFLITHKLKSNIYIYHTNETSIYEFYSTLQHELGHHNDYRLNGITEEFFDFTFLKTGEEYDNDPSEIYANNFELLPKCGCTIDYCYAHDRLAMTKPITYKTPSSGSVEGMQERGDGIHIHTPTDEILSFFSAFFPRFHAQDRQDRNHVLSYFLAHPSSELPDQEVYNPQVKTIKEGEVSIHSLPSFFSEVDKK